MRLKTQMPSDRVTRLSQEDAEARLIDLLGSRYAEYRNAWNSAGPDSIPAFPIHLDLELYDNCNQSCVFCPRNTTIHKDLIYPINTSQRLEARIMERVLEEVQVMGLYSVNFGAYAEPLLNTSIFELVRRFHAAGVVDSRVISNGLLLHKYRDSIIDSGLVNLFISIDAFSEQTYRKQRGPGYDRIVRNLLDFLELRAKLGASLPIVRASFVVTDDNRKELGDFVEFWGDKVDFIDVQSKTDYRTSALAQERTRTFDCIDPFRRVAIISNGDILPCCTFWGRTLPVGNITGQTIAATNGASSRM